MKTLLKYLHEQVTTTTDPNVIMHTNRHIRSIENLKADVKRTIKMHARKNGVEPDMFVMSADSCTEGRVSIGSSVNTKTKTEIQNDCVIQVPAKRKRIEISNVDSDSKENACKFESQTTTT